MDLSELGIIDTETTNIQLNKKIQRLEDKIDELTKTNNIMKNRIDNLESLVTILCGKLNVSINENTTDTKELELEDKDKDKEITWIYSINSGESIDNILKRLKVTKDSTVVVELNTLTDLSNEFFLIKTLIDNLNKNIKPIKDNNLGSSLNSDIYSKRLTDTINQLSALNMIIVIRDYPSLINNKYNSLLGFLAGTLNEIWEDNEKLLVVALVVESTIPYTKIKANYKGETMLIEFEELK